MAVGAWQHCAHVAFVSSDERVVAVDLERTPDIPQILSASASAVWNAIDGERSDDAIVTEVAEAYGIAPAQIEGDVLQFLTEMADSGLIARIERP